MAHVEKILAKRAEEAKAATEAQWDNGAGSLHPDYDPYVVGEHVQKASRETEELYLAIVKDDVAAVYDAIERGADIDFVFGPAYKCLPGYTPLMVAAHRNRLHCAAALLRAGADPNFTNRYGDHVLFWAIDGGVEMIQLMVQYGANLEFVNSKGWSPLSYAVAKGKYGATEDKGIYPEDVLRYYGASKYGSGPPALGSRSPRNSFNPDAPGFCRERGSYQEPMPHP